MEFPPSSRPAVMVLPKLSISKSPCRRDSLSSSRTKDSGYNSDLDSLSPLDALYPEHDLLFTSLPLVPEVLLGPTTLPQTKCNTITRRQSNARPRRVSFPPSTEGGLSREQPGCADAMLLATSSVRTIRNISSRDADIEEWIQKNLPNQGADKARLSSIVSISSTSSCEMYTDTDISGDEVDIKDTPVHGSLPRSTLKTIDLILRKMERHLALAAYTQSTQQHNSSTSNGRTGHLNTQSHDNGDAAPGSSRKRKEQCDNSLPPDEEDGDGCTKRSRGSVIMTDDSEAGVRFACPFFKHDPDRYRNRRTCPGPGWTAVHRVKEHLYRSHAQPIFCPICYVTFKSDREQLDHVRLQQCQRSAPQQVEGIDRETIWTLRKRTTAARLEEDKWRDTYHILFPEVPIPDIPSPFYDCDSPNETSRRFRRELLRRVQEELFTTADHLPSPAEQQLLLRVADIIRRCEQDILNPHTPSNLAPMPTDRRSSNVSTISTVSDHDVLPTVPTPQLHTEFRNNDWDIKYIGTDTVENASDFTGGMVGFNTVEWLDPAQQVFSLGIDWDGIFPSSATDHVL